MYKTFVGYFIASLILGLVAPIQAQNPMVDLIRDAITDPNCEAACFLGVQPGITSADELVAIIEINNLSYRKNQLPDTELYSYGISWPENDPRFPFIDVVVSFDITPFYLTQYNYDVVEGINFFIKGINLSDMLTLFPNPPDRIITIFTPVFLYVDEGVGFYINTVSNIEAVYGLLLISPQDLDALLFMNDDIRPCVEPATLCNIPRTSSILDFTIDGTSVGEARLGEPSDIPYEANMEITAQTYPEQVGSVVFSDGSMTIIDDTAPYSWVVPGPGSYLLKARPYSEPGGQGTAGTPLSILFNVAGLPSGCDYAVRSVSMWYKPH